MMLALTVVVAVVSTWLVLGKWECDSRFSPMSKSDVVLLSSFILLAVLLTLCLDRPDADDEGYLALAIMALDYVHLPMQDIPIGTIGKIQGYSLSYFETFQATITYLTGIPILVSHYFVVPSILAVFSILIHWRILRQLVEHRWVVGMFFFFIVMLVWGDVHRTHANFGFVRAFQGKAGLVMVVAPGILHYFLKYQQSYERKYAALLFFTLVAGVGLTPTGIIVGPMLLGLLILANFKMSKKELKNNLILCVSFVIPMFLGLIMKFYFDFEGSVVHTENGFQEHTTNLEMLRFVVGEGYRGFFALLCLALSPLCVTNSKVQKTFRNFVLILVVMLLFPYTSEIIARSTYATASWRWLWVIPFPLIMGVVMSRCFYFDYRLKGIPVTGILFTFLTLLYIYSSQRFVFAAENYASIGAPVFKLHDQKKIKLRSYGEYGFIRGNYIYIGKPERKF